MKNPLIIKLILFITIIFSAYLLFGFFQILVLEEMEKNKLCEKEFPMNKKRLDHCKKHAILYKRNGHSYITGVRGGA